MKKSKVSRFKSAYDPVDDKGFQTTGESMTQQHLAESCDINHIVPRYESTGVIDHVASFKAHYGDFVGLPDYLHSFNLIDDSIALFEALPSDVRDRFSNDPGDFLEFANDPDNFDEMKKMGLVSLNETSPSDSSSQKTKAVDNPDQANSSELPKEGI